MSPNMVIEVTNTFSCENNDAPLYLHRANQIAPNLAYISLDLETGNITAKIKDKAATGSFPLEQNSLVNFYITPYLNSEFIQSLIESHLSRFQSICDMSVIKLDQKGEKQLFVQVDYQNSRDRIIQDLANDLAIAAIGNEDDNTSFCASYDLIYDAVSVSPSTPDLSQYASTLLDEINSKFTIDENLKLEEFKLIVLHCYVESLNILNFNALTMLFDNVELCENEFSVSRDQLEKELSPEQTNYLLHYPVIVNAIEPTPFTDNLNDYAEYIFEKLSGKYQLADSFDVCDIKRMVMSELSQNIDCLNENGISILLNNASQYGFYYSCEEIRKMIS